LIITSVLLKRVALQQFAVDFATSYPDSAFFVIILSLLWATVASEQRFSSDVKIIALVVMTNWTKLWNLP
jgi:hypothetical protein